VRSEPVIDALVQISTHRGQDDLLSAGLGLEGLRNPLPPILVNADMPSAAELRRRAIHANWRGIADLAGINGLGDLSRALPHIPGREWSTFATLPGRGHSHRLLVQVPDEFNAQQRCLVVTASSGSRGVYGAIALAGAWGLPRGCAIAYTDKGAGTGFFDIDTAQGVALDGTRCTSGMMEFAQAPINEARTSEHCISIKHAHSGDNPEADWGRHVLQAAAFGLQALDAAFPHQAPFSKENTRIIAVGLSNGGAAVLRASELDDTGMLAAVVAIAPNIAAPSRGRVLFDYATEAALFAPCVATAMSNAVALLPSAVRDRYSELRGASLHGAGLLARSNPAAQSREALDYLRAQGWSPEAIALSEQNIAFDLWRTLVATYAQSYARASVHAPICGYGFAVLTADGRPRASTAAERALWWADASGIAPTAGVGIVDTLAEGEDSAFAGLMSLRRLWLGQLPQSTEVLRSIAATRSNARPLTKRVHILHGVADALLPIDFSSRAYVADARDQGIVLEFTEVPNAQHFDAFLTLPTMSRYQPLLPHAYRALDAML
jgi:hydroxybutyrate-dimer hydrolase